MSNWIAIAKADLYNSKAAALIDAADSVQLGVGQTDRTTGVIADVTLEIRRRVGKEYAVDADPTKIPGGLKPLAVDLIYCRLKIALEQELSPAELQMLARRERELDRISDGKDVVEAPDTPLVSNAEQTIPAPSFGDCRPHHHRFGMDQ
ncbi:MAG: hypothetical protein KGL39_59195 [Patescibacteria group bacterium]|nr:hypothetical protein [Patescibacteria group bacterium]